VGFPYMPPFWALGWHQCRWGYKSVLETSVVVDTYDKFDLPLDTIWNDIDYMDAYKDFTSDPKTFPAAQLRAFVKRLHDTSMQYMMIVDPGIKNEGGYKSYTDLLDSKAYINDAAGKPLIGKVWPGTVIFPDFLHPNATDYWFSQLKSYYDSGPEFDGIWIDMNEVSNFCDGQCATEGEKFETPENPPYVPGGFPLSQKTANVTATTYLSNEYNTHNLYGWSEGIVTKQAAEKLRGKRSVVISRSTFAGTGRHNGHWLGDNNSDYSDLYYSIPGVLAMQFFGIPLVGADICGFGGDTTEELCTRWMELGTLYPFARNHNSIDSRSQEPYAFGATLLNTSRNALERRYSLLSYYYTLFHLASTTGSTVWRPLFFEFAKDTNTFAIDTQFLIGPALLVSPVLTQGRTQVDAYIPNEVWYDWYTGVEETRRGRVALPAPINFIPIHIRGGYIIPIQTPATTSAKTRLNPFNLIVALNRNGESSGSLFLDDGNTIDTVQKNLYNIVTFNLAHTQDVYSLQSTISGGKYDGLSKLAIVNVTFLGVPEAPTQLTVNKVKADFSYFNNKRLVVPRLALPLSAPFSIVWE